MAVPFARIGRFPRPDQPPYRRLSTVYPLPEPFALRDRTDTDQAFVQALYSSTREDLRQALPDPAQLLPLLAMQQNAQEAGFRRQFPEARQWLLLRSGRPIGRVVVDAAAQNLRVVDIAIVPEARRSGAATAVLRALQAHALAQGLPLCLAVAHGNHAAQSLYRRLGFATTSEDGTHAQMVWRGEHA